MKIMKNKTYYDLIDKVKIADTIITALHENKIYTNPISLDAVSTVQDCVFIGTDHSPLLNIEDKEISE